MKLYEINAAIRNFEYEYDPETGEWLNEDEWNELAIARDTKIEGIACLAKEARAEYKAICEEMEHLKARAEQSKKRAEGLEKWLTKELQGKSMVTTRASILFRASETTDILFEDMIPEKYMVVTTKVERRPDKDAIKKAIKAGEEVAGAVVTQHCNITVK